MRVCKRQCTVRARYITRSDSQSEKSTLERSRPCNPLQHTLTVALTAPHYCPTPYLEERVDQRQRQLLERLLLPAALVQHRIKLELAILWEDARAQRRAHMHEGQVAGSTRCMVARVSVVATGAGGQVDLFAEAVCLAGALPAHAAVSSSSWTAGRVA